MSLQDWLDNKWLRKHQTSPQEIGNLLEIVKRDIKDANFWEVSADWRFGIAYNAALKLCTILLYAKGYRPERVLAHYRTIQALPLILGKDREGDINYLNACRIKRNKVEYDYTGGVTHLPSQISSNNE
ncbi:MAG: hypothetical protein GH151_13130 [Bacteroidetes bacterium]|nr:hypothetical protein [Bacteroidota bacterium]